MMLKPVLVLLFVCVVVSNAGNVLQLLKNRATHSQFAELLESTEGVHKHYMEGYLTLFAPSNTALNQYKGDRNKALLLNHIASAFPHSNLQTVNTAISEDELEERLTSLLQGHPPLWVRRKNSELYVNQAKVSLVLPVTTDTGNKQFLYLIDSVLEPLIPQAENSVADYVDIKAGDILNNTQKYKLGEYSIDKYTEQIRSLGMDKFPEFEQYGKYTFFLPVDSAFQGLDKGLVDQEVVKSHIVPGNLLFTQPSSRQGQYSELFPSLQYKQVSMEVKVGVSMYESDDGSIKVQSQTMTGNRNHPRGQVISTIVKVFILIKIFIFC
ncbi:fasciclin-1 [Eurytemora carolleeae]|uniref:fasciclin-1 n=1 Tax=Eurytemora carolleeae TaxID=1294199 RepID=UPI000C771A47|nr:fasciclin-1 [Eurytemora carolleeae]|eukprot:XP_023339723.1 fasciclin-1-like [Eurytemora affinis]